MGQKIASAYQPKVRNCPHSENGFQKLKTKPTESEILRPISKIQLDSEDNKLEIQLKKNLDNVKNRVLKRRNYLMDLQDKLEEYSKTNTLIVDEEASTKRIKILENKVDNLMIKFNEAMNIKRMYEGLILSLKQQRTTYDKKLVRMERESADKEQEMIRAFDQYQKQVNKKQHLSQKYKEYENRRDEVQSQREKYLMTQKNNDLENEQLRKQALSNKRKTTQMNNETEASNIIHNHEPLSDHENESIDYDFLEEFFQRIFEISGAKDGFLKSE